MKNDHELSANGMGSSYGEHGYHGFGYALSTISHQLCLLKRLLSVAIGVSLFFAATNASHATITGNPGGTCPCTGTATVGIQYSFSFTSSLTGNPTYSVTGTLPPGLSATSNTISGTPTTVGTYPGITLKATKGASTDSSTLTIIVATEYRITVKYDWSAQSNASYLGNATQFLGTKAWGQIFQPPAPVSGLYFKNNKPGFGVASIDALVQSARQAGQCTGTSTPPTCTVTCYADWLPQYPAPPGSTATLTVTLYDSNGIVVMTGNPATRTITPGSNYSTGLPSTLVETITYTYNVSLNKGSFTVSP